MCRLAYLDSGHHSGRKIRVAGFFLLETHFQLKIPEKHPNNIFKPIVNLQKCKKSAKNPKLTRKPISS
jgi:hypothetical protein